MFKSILILLLAMLSVQISASFAKGLFPLVGAAGASALRLFFASLVLICIYRPWRISFSKESIKSLFLYGLALGLMNLTFYFALQKIPLGIAVALEFTGPLAVAIFSSRKVFDYLWAVLASIGIFLLIPTEATEASLDPWGVFFALAAGFFWALYIIFGKRAGQSISGGIAATMGMFFAATVVIPFGAFLEGSRMFNTEALPIGLLVAVVGSALPYSLEMIALKNMPTRTFGILMSLEPALAALSGLIFLSEKLTILQSVAVVCVMISSLGSSISSHNSK